MNRPQVEQKEFSGGLYEIFASIEQQFIANRTHILRSSIQSFDGNIRHWRAEQMAKAAELRVLNAQTLARVKDELQNKIVQLNTDAYSKGVDNVSERSGGKADKVAAVVGGAIAGLLYERISTMFGEVRQAERLSIAASDQQYFEIVAKAERMYSGGDLAKVIDIAARDSLDKGVVGAVNKSGALLNIATLADGIERNGEHKAMLVGQGEQARKEGLTLVLISAHPTSCPLCYPWQNQFLVDDVYSGGQPDGKHELLSTAIDAGLFHYNCLHNFIYVESDDKTIFDRYIQPERENDLNYKIRQEQRYNEENIRRWRRREEGALTSGERQYAQLHKEQWLQRQRDLQKIAKQNGLEFYRQKSREQLGGETKPILPDAASKYKADLTKIQESGTINARNTATGKASAIKILDAELNKRQQGVLSKLPEDGAEYIASKRLIKTKDIAALTAKENVEFTLFTKGDSRLIVRGSAYTISLPPERLKTLADDGWRWTAHSHISTGLGSTWASDGDMNVLYLFKQSRSVIYNSKGEFEVFYKEE